jgi:hypothetical protein
MRLNLEPRRIPEYLLGMALVVGGVWSLIAGYEAKPVNIEGGNGFVTHGATFNKDGRITGFSEISVGGGQWVVGGGDSDGFQVALSGSKEKLTLGWTQDGGEKLGSKSWEY